MELLHTFILKLVFQDYDNGTKHHTAYVLSDLIGETVGAYYGEHFFSLAVSIFSENIFRFYFEKKTS